VATRRLEAIARASELGAGFQVAMYDLEIRGAGEFLGSRQHGHIAAVGFDLYTRMLTYAVEKLKKEMAAGHRPSEQQEGTEPVPKFLVEKKEPLRESTVPYLEEPLGKAIQITLPLPAFLPEDYAGDADLRLQLYRRLARLCSEKEIAEMQHELEDRFGPLPEAATLLLYQLRLKALALAAGVESIATDSDQVVVRYGQLSQTDRQYVSRRLGGEVRLGRVQAWLPLDDRGVWQKTLVRVLEVLGQARTMHVA
jgi:transcription-repair coupling factor (superfamily II helicase)